MNHTKPFWFSSEGVLMLELGGAAVWNGNKGRQTDRGGEKPQSRRGWSSTYLEVCDLIKAKLVYANKSKALWSDIITHAYTACVQMFPVRNIISTSKLSKVERTVINIVMSNNSGGSGHHGGLTPKQTSPGLNNYNMITASSGKKKWVWVWYRYVVPIKQSREKNKCYLDMMMIQVWFLD